MSQVLSRMFCLSWLNCLYFLSKNLGMVIFFIFIFWCLSPVQLEPSSLELLISFHKVTPTVKHRSINATFIQY